MSFRVTLSANAEKDLDNVLAWLTKHSSDGAKRWIVALEQAIDRLEDSALSFGPAAEASVLGEGVREHLFSTPSGRKYRLIYEVTGNRVDILRIRAPGQPPLTTR